MNKIRISGKHFQGLKNHLFPGDGKEAVAIALCGRSKFKNTHTLLLKELHLIPYEECIERREDFVHWSTESIRPLIEKAAQKGLAILKIHSHPGGYDKFSEIDNESDKTLFTSIHAWLDDEMPHASCIMLPDGRMIGRFFTSNMVAELVHQISVSGSDIYNWYYSENENLINEDAQIRNLQAFGKKTITMLNRFKVGVVGCSGTGSPTIEQLKRLGVGELVLVDPDYVDSVNLNRIIGSTSADALEKKMKVKVMERGITELGIGTKVICFPSHITDPLIVKELADCDVLFGCVDGAEGRHFLNLISSYYLIPLIDMGVKFSVDGQGGIKGIFGTVHFIQPYGSSLLSRGQYNIESLRSEEMKRVDKDEFERNQYLSDANEPSPAVISVNTQISAIAVNELLARIHPYRNFENIEIDAMKVNFNEGTTFPESLSDPCDFFIKNAGKGDVTPLLNYIEFTINDKVAI